jgi:recombinational DNA repair protein RecR
LISKLEKETQRDLLLWSLNNIAGNWKICKKCGKNAEKDHLEICVFGKEEIVHIIQNSKDKNELERIGKKIHEIKKWVKYK